MVESTGEVIWRAVVAEANAVRVASEVKVAPADAKVVEVARDEDRVGRMAAGRVVQAEARATIDLIDHFVRKHPTNNRTDIEVVCSDQRLFKHTMKIPR